MSNKRSRTEEEIQEENRLGEEAADITSGGPSDPGDPSDFGGTDPLEEDDLALGEEEADSNTLDDDEEMTFEVDELAKGIGLGKLIDIKKNKAKSSGAEQLLFEFKFVDGPNSGKKITEFIQTGASTRWKMTAMLNALRVPVIDGEQKLKKSEVLGRVVVLDIQPDTYQGETRMKVKKATRASDSQIEDYEV